MSDKILLENVIRFYDPENNPHQRDAILLLQSHLDSKGLTNSDVPWVKIFRTPRVSSPSNHINLKSFKSYLQSVPVNRNRLNNNFPTWHNKVIDYLGKFNFKRDNFRLAYAHFWSQALHETDAFHGLIEYGDFNYFKPYANHPSLGNEGCYNNAFRYRGAGLMHTTGKYNYRRLSEAVNDPDILTKGAVYLANNYAVESATFFWDNSRLVDRAIRNPNFRNLREKCEAVTRIVNGGLTHFQRRFNYFQEILQVI